ncbi:MAG: MASE1 domain-containing protein [Blastocatellia bacterium]
MIREPAKKFRPILYPLLLLVVCAIYFGSARLGLSLAFLHANVSPVWPPTGVAIAAVWLLGYRIAPAIAVGALLANLATDVSLITASGIAVGNTLEAVTAVFLLRRFVGRRPFYRTPDILKFVVIAAISTIISATLGNLSLCLGGASWNNFGALWLTWWLGDGGGALIVTPLLVIWLDQTAERWPLRRLAEGLLLLVSSSSVAAIIFDGWLLPRVARYPLEHLIVPFLLWAAFRFGPRGATTTIAILATIAVWGTRSGNGPFVEPTPNESLLILQVFVAAVAIMTLVLAAIVSERRQAEEALRANQGQLRLITDITPVMLTQCSRDQRYRFANHAYAEIFGLRSEQIIGQHIPDVIGEEAYKTILPYIEKVLTGEAVEFEADLPYREVGSRFMRVAYKPERDATGNVVGWVASLSDITESKRAEAQIKGLNTELQRRIEEFQALIDTAPVGIGITLDAECKDLWGNREFARMLGSDQQQNLSKSNSTALGLSFKVFSDGNEVAAAELPMLRACREGRAVLDDELTIVRGDGTVIHELCRAIPLKDEQGKVRGCIGVFLDITERKRVEVEREQLLLREHDARDEAEAANRVKDEFLATISHELRTPLNSMMGWAQLLRQGNLDEPNVGRGLETIERNARAQAQLIDDLLDVSRIITGKLRLNTGPVEFGEIIQAAIDMVRPGAAAKDIQLEFIASNAACIIAGDPERLQQIVGNLLSNAIKFTPKGGRVVSRLESTEGNARLTIADNGEGIPPEFLPHVFDHFRQADNSRTRRHGGLGLGLAIVHHLTELHGGTVEAHSDGPQRGATFTVTLPLIARANNSMASTGEQSGAPGDTPPRLLGVRLLLVEDDPDSLEVLRVLVELHGAEVKTAARTSEALKIIEQWIPDVLISDIGLPDEDGYALLAKARRLAQAQDKQIPAIALTGYAGEHEGRRALSMGFQHYFTKPTEPRKLIAAIASLASHDDRRRTTADR